MIYVSAIMQLCYVFNKNCIQRYNFYNVYYEIFQFANCYWNVIVNFMKCQKQSQKITILSGTTESKTQDCDVN